MPLWGWMIAAHINYCWTQYTCSSIAETHADALSNYWASRQAGQQGNCLYNRPFHIKWWKRLGYILAPFCWKFIFLLMGNEETLTVCYSPCVGNSIRNFEPLAWSIYRFVDLACKTLLHQPAKATYPHRYNTFALFTLWWTLSNTKVSSV